MGKMVKFILIAFLFLFVLGMVIELIEQFGGVLIPIVIVVAVLAVVGKFSPKSTQSNQKPPKPKKNKMETLDVELED